MILSGGVSGVGMLGGGVIWGRDGGMFTGRPSFSARV